MKRFQYQLFLLAFLAFPLVLPLTTVVQGQALTNDSPQLQVLSNYVGTWDALAGPTDSPFATGRFTVKWILDGRFIQGTGTLKTADGSNDFSVTTIITYDTNSNNYRYWSFFSHGMTSESEGTWDDATKTMTQITRYGDVTQTTKSNFSEGGIERWTQVATDTDGNILSELSGTNTRVNALTDR